MSKFRINLDSHNETILKHLEMDVRKLFLQYLLVPMLLSAAEGQRPRNYLSCCSCWIFVSKTHATSHSLSLFFHFYIFSFFLIFSITISIYRSIKYVYQFMPTYLSQITYTYLSMSTYLHLPIYVYLSTSTYLPIYVYLSTSTYLPTYINILTYL